MKTKRVKFDIFLGEKKIAEFTDELPDEWDVQMCEFRCNDSSWCTSNIFSSGELNVIDDESMNGLLADNPDGCICFSNVDFKVANRRYEI